MIEYYGFFSCLISCKIIFILISSNLQEIQNICSGGEPNVVACTDIEKNSIFTFIFIWKEAMNIKAVNDLCNRSIYSHELYRAKYQDTSIILGGCK